MTRHAMLLATAAIIVVVARADQMPVQEGVDPQPRAHEIHSYSIPAANGHLEGRIRRVIVESTEYPRRGCLLMVEELPHGGGPVGHGLEACPKASGYGGPGRDIVPLYLACNTPGDLDQRLWFADRDGDTRFRHNRLRREMERRSAARMLEQAQLAVVARRRVNLVVSSGSRNSRGHCQVRRIDLRFEAAW